MCTIIVLKSVSPVAPLVIAANRDEFYARPTRPPEPVAGTRAMAGVDERGGGTWLGVTAAGTFAGLTNQRQGRAAASDRVSRGAVVTAALGRASVASQDAALRQITPATYNPFNLVYGDATALRCAYVRDDGVQFEDIGDGVSVLANDVLGSPRFPKASRARALATSAAAAAGSSWPRLAAGLTAVLADHSHRAAANFDDDEASPLTREMLAALDALCIHTPLYGTRSFTLLALAPGRVLHYHHGEGPPCESPALDLTGALAAL